MASTFFGNDWDYKYNFIDGQHVRNLYLCLTIESEGHNSVLNDMTYRPPGSQQTFFLSISDCLLTLYHPYHIYSRSRQNRIDRASPWTYEPSNPLAHKCMASHQHHDYWSQKETMQFFRDYWSIFTIEQGGWGVPVPMSDIGRADR